MRTDLLRATREGFERNRRAMDVRIRRPAWLTNADPLAGTYSESELLLREGALVLGVAVHVNEHLLRPGDDAHPGSFVFATPHHPTTPMLVDLLRVRDGIRGALVEQSALADVQQFAAWFAEYHRPSWLPVPNAIAQGRPFFVTSVIVHRDIPAAYLCAPFLPMLVHTKARNALVLPAAHWAADLRDVFLGWLDG